MSQLSYRTLRENVESALRMKILNQELAPGTRVVEHSPLKSKCASFTKLKILCAVSAICGYPTKIYQTFRHKTELSTIDNHDIIAHRLSAV